MNTRKGFLYWKVHELIFLRGFLCSLPAGFFFDQRRHLDRVCRRQSVPLFAPFSAALVLISDESYETMVAVDFLSAPISFRLQY